MVKKISFIGATVHKGNSVLVYDDSCSQAVSWRSSQAVVWREIDLNQTGEVDFNDLSSDEQWEVFRALGLEKEIDDLIYYS
jgi:hypothetical protein